MADQPRTPTAAVPNEESPARKITFHDLWIEAGEERERHEILLAEARRDASAPGADQAYCFRVIAARQRKVDLYQAMQRLFERASDPFIIERLRELTVGEQAEVDPDQAEAVE
jgi:hypothetical protein